MKGTIPSFLLQNSLIRATQHGFLPKKSSATALLSFLENATAAMEDGNCSDILYLDFRKAFDSVPHKRLIEKLSSYSISEHLILWISSFLSDRKQFVKIGSCSSQCLKVESRVPQGSILGRLLFLIYLNNKVTSMIL